MDKSKKISAKPEEINPEIIFANYITVPPGKSWPTHKISDLELVLILNGTWTASDKDHPVTPLRQGDVLLIRPGIPCDLLQLKGDLKGPAIISCIHFELLAGKKWGKGDYSIFPSEPWVVNSSGDLSLIELFRRCASEFNGFKKFKKEMMSSIFKQIWLLLMRFYVTGKRPRNTHISPRKMKIERMLEFIKENYTSAIGRNEISAEFHLTPQYVNFIFKRELGMTPGEVIATERIHRAAEILSTGKVNIAEAAYLCGFNDPLYFSRVFKRIFGTSPSNYNFSFK